MNEQATLLALPESVQQHLHADRAEMAGALARHVAHALLAGIRKNGRASLLVSGGRSPIAFFEALSTQVLPWDHVGISLVDERWVAAYSPNSNEALVRKHLLRERAAQASLIPLMGGEADPASGLAAATRRVSALSQPFDVVVLGMGTDGHTASWFPCADDTPAAMDPAGTEVLAAVHPTSAPHARITFTVPALFNARQLIVAIEGAAKREVIEQAAAAGDAAPPIAAVLRQNRAPVHVFFAE